MSGELGYLIYLPVALPAAVGAAAVKAVGEAGVAAAKAAAEYEKRRREERELIRQSGILEEMKGFRHSLTDLMKEEEEKNRALSKEFESSLANTREDLLNQISELGDDKEIFAENAQDTAAQMLRTMDEEQKKLQSDYRDLICREVEAAQKEEAERLDSVRKSLSALSDAEKMKNQALQTEARKQLDESKELLDALTGQFQGNKYIKAERIKIHREAYKKAEELFSTHNFESSLIAASSLSAGLRSDILAADEKRMEFENWQKTALLLVEENLAFLKANGTLSEEMFQLIKKEYEDQWMEVPLDETWIGKPLCPFWGRTEDGKFYYEAVTAQLEQQKEQILSEDCPMSAEKLKKISEEFARLNPALIAHLPDVYERLLNARQREELSGRIIDRMEEMGFTYESFSYLRETREGETVADREDPNARLSIAFSDSAGDEILVELSNHRNRIRLDVTDMAEEYDPEIDRSAYRERIEENIREIVFDTQENGAAEHVTGGCTRAGQQIVATPESRRRLRLVTQDITE